MKPAAPAPPWDAADTAKSLWSYGLWLTETARATFLADGTHVEIFFLVLPDGQMALGQPPLDMDRGHLTRTLKQTVEKNNICGVIHVVEAWTYIPRQPNDHTFKQLAAGEMKVSQLKPEDRTEALMVRLETRAGVNHLWLSPILRDAAGVSLGEPLDIDQRMEGRLGTFFS